MASIVERPRKGGQSTFQVKWRQDGGWETEKFADFDSADQFRGLVEAHGDRWPSFPRLIPRPCTVRHQTVTRRPHQA